MAELTSTVAGHIAREKARLESSQNDAVIDRILGVLGRSGGGDLIFGDAVTNGEVTTVPVLEARRDGPIPVGYIEAREDGATFHKTVVSDVPEYLLFATLFLLPIVILVLVIRWLIVSQKKLQA